MLKEWSSRYDVKQGEPGLSCSRFAAVILLQEGHLDEAMRLDTLNDDTDSYQDVMAAIKRKADFGK